MCAGVTPGEEIFIVQRKTGAFLVAHYKGHGAHPAVVDDDTGRQVGSHLRLEHLMVLHSSFSLLVLC